MLKYLLIAVALFFTKALFAESQKILISEFLAINSSVIQDEDGEYSDWIELYNPGETDINLSGWFLTDNAENLSKWLLPDMELKADSYLLIFASGKDRFDPTKNLHTNFKLSGSGEFLAIVEPGGEEISHAYGDAFPAQREDVSYGLYQQQVLVFYDPTPGQSNVLSDQPLPPSFSHTRNFYTSPFNVTLSNISGGEIYYTTDGTIPSKETGKLYISPISIQTNTPLSAISYGSENVKSEVITHTYLFTNKVVSQPSNPPGFPSEWGPLKFGKGNAPADYEMDPEIVNNPKYKDVMDEALKAIPTLSLVTTPGNMFSHIRNNTTGGIYIFTGDTGSGSLGIGWERPVSMEFFDPQTQKQIQVNCGVLLHGGNSRLPDNSPKHSLRLSFRSKYGPSKLKFNFFEEKTASNEFNSLVLRAGYNYSWLTNVSDARTDAQYLQDPFAKTTQLDMGYVAAHQRFVHLYINGLYWGVYNVSEKLTNDFMSTYLKGKEEDFDVVKDHLGIVDGNRKYWDNLLVLARKGLTDNADYQKIQGRNPDGTINPAYDNLLDLKNFIDYMQLNIFIGNEDWDHNNWVAARNNVNNEDGFRFYCWDAETSMTDLNANMVGENNENNPSEIYQALKKNADFKLLFADRIQKNFFNGGPLSPDATRERYERLANELDVAIIAETARWGDFRRDVMPVGGLKVLYTRNDYWLPRKEYLLNTYFPNRSAKVVQQFKSAGLFPSIQAPALSHTGGDVPSPINVEMTTNMGDIYYTLDGTDPREEISSSIASGAQKYNGMVYIAATTKLRARAKSGSQWSPITKAKYDFGEVTSISDVFASNAILSGSYPNPFKSSTQIHFTLPFDGEVQLDMYTIDGKRVENLYSNHLTSGKHSINWDATNHSTGIYLYKIQYNGSSYVGKIIKN